jgi:hypothetical protein
MKPDSLRRVDKNAAIYRDMITCMVAPHCSLLPTRPSRSPMSRADLPRRGFYLGNAHQAQLTYE